MTTPRVEVAVGDAADPWTFGPVDVADFVRYAGASGDFNRLHYDPDYAEAAGFVSIFAQGMFHAGLLATFATNWFTPDAMRRFYVRFVDVVWPGDTLICTGEVTKKYVDGEERRVDVDLFCRRQTGTLVLRGSATFALGGTGR